MIIVMGRTGGEGGRNQNSGEEGGWSVLESSTLLMQGWGSICQDGRTQ